MQNRKSKKLWLFLTLCVIVLGSICFLAFGEKETEVYANGRVVELQDAHDAGLFSHYCRSDQSPALRQAAPEWRTV